ncbi:tripartite tricarboxylate transporter TctB family protein [Bosea caraganae]|nr:tripartite tricarboxylate transporter TctB family protein [Bosea caraganae]
MSANTKDLACGAVFTGVGVLYGGMAWTSLPIGRALAMGPGYFPALMALILTGLGLAILVRAFLTSQENPFGAVPWRAVAFIAVAVLFFYFCLEQIGMFPTVFITTLLACAANDRFRIVESAIAGLVVATFCTLVFGYLLRLPVPLFASPFGG